MNDIAESLRAARKPGGLHCFECESLMFSPMDKLCLALFDKCTMHLEENGVDTSNLLKISSLI